MHENENYTGGVYKNNYVTNLIINAHTLYIAYYIMQPREKDVLLGTLLDKFTNSILFLVFLFKKLINSNV